MLPDFMLQQKHPSCRIQCAKRVLILDYYVINWKCVGLYSDFVYVLVVRFVNLISAAKQRNIVTSFAAANNFNGILARNYLIRDGIGYDIAGFRLIQLLMTIIILGGHISRLSG